MKVSSAKLKITPDIFSAYLLLSPMWLLPKPGYATTLWPTAQFCCITLYPFSQGSLQVSLRKSTLDLHPWTHSSKHERGHANTSLALTHEKSHEALIMLAEGPISMPHHRYVQLSQVAQPIEDSTSPSYQISLLTSLETLSKYLIIDLEF